METIENKYGNECSLLREIHAFYNFFGLIALCVTYLTF